MVLRAFWGPLGLLLGALGGLLGAILGLQIDPNGLRRSGPFALEGLLVALGGLLRSSGVLLVVFWGLLSSLGIVLGAFGSPLGAIFTLCRTILNSTTGFPSIDDLCLSSASSSSSPSSCSPLVYVIFFFSLIFFIARQLSFGHVAA